MKAISSSNSKRTRSKKLLGTSASLLVTSALLVVTRTLLVTRKRPQTTLCSLRLEASVVAGFRPQEPL